MNDKTKAPGSAATLTGAAEKAAFGGAAFSTTNTTSDGAGRQGRIFSLLLEGEENAIPAPDLARLAGYGSTRALRFAVDRLRSKGVPVLASDAGYFRPSDGPVGVAEIRKFLRRQDAQMASNRKVTRLIRARLRAYEKAPLPGQTDLWQRGDDT